MAAASVTATRPVQAGPYLKSSLVSERANLMCSAPLFRGLSHQECEKIALIARAKSFARDEALFTQGQPVQSLMLIRTGCVKITQISSGGDEVILWMYGPGNVIGTFSELSSNRHTSSARAMEAGTAFMWDYPAIEKMAVEFPQIRKNISQILADRLHELEERFREVATEKVPKRLASVLLRLVKNVGKSVHGGTEVSLSREELAQMTGATLFTVSRILSRWSKENYVLPRRESVVICDPQRLSLADNEL